MKNRLHMTLAMGVAALGLMAGNALAETELRMTWYNDGIEGEVMRGILDKFEADNPDIKVTLDVVPYKAILESLPVQLAAGEGPDIARVTDLGGLSKYYMDLTPYISDPAYWEENFGPFLKWLRQPGDTSSISGFMTQLTVTGPYVNKTLFEQAEVEMPGEGATWDDWAKASKEVADKLDIPIPMAWDRSGHRVAGPAISMGAKMFDADGEPALVDDGLKLMATKLYDWHQDGTMAKELWGSVSGSQYLGANEDFANAKVVMYMSGSWQIPQFADTIGDAFDWWAVPAPCGPAACTGMPGGASLVALKTSKHPEEVGKLMDYLSSEEVLGEFYGKTLFIPGHLGLASKGVDFATDDPRAKHALSTFSSAVPSISPIAFDLQGYVNNRVMFNALISRLGEAIVGELTLDQAFDRMTQDVEQQIAEKKRGG
ncbi:ABC transporter substrate-binding protein [Oricola sp.]|uniref:ABC transporter substrate-binding protein n=1 Tax=Oricola sp. TaxID=1979950 RepID=UPI000C8D06BF|nr:ABC transporter substrate-binding protein [Ahrensia sp.]|tara:strand:- start:7486 stop:8772 length:1287 start_codon:yes stop_codon:yes gene_type:complete